MDKYYLHRTLSIMFVMFCSIWINAASVGIYYQNELLPTYQSIYVYKSGELVESSNQYSTQEATFSKLTSGVNYTYMTKTNHSGSITSTSSIKLTCAKIVVQILNSSNKPIVSENVKIYEDGEEVASEYTNEEGEAIFYLKPSDKYAYQCEFGMGKTGETVANKETKVKLQGLIMEIIPKYGDLPIPGTYSLYEYGNSSYSNTSRYLYKYNDGVLRFNATSGQQYWIKTKYGNFSSPITPLRSNTKFYLEHKKVTFVSNSTDPNILKNIMIGGQYGETRITDGRGYAVFYLLPGEYTYSHLAGSGTLTVGDQDQTIRLTTSNVQVSLTGLSKGHQQFTVLDENGTATTYTGNYDNKADVRVMGKNFIVRINGLGNWTCSTSSNSVSIPVHTLTVKSDVNQSSLYLSDGYGHSTSIASDKPICLIEGAYTLHQESNTTDFTLTSDQSIDARTCTFELTVKEANGTPVPYSTYYIYKEGKYVSQLKTGKDGTSHINLGKGEYDLCYTDGQLISSFSITFGKTQLSITEPSLLTVKVLRKGKPYTGYVYFSPDYVTTQTVNCVDGVCKVRMNKGNYYIYNTGVSPYRKKINIFDGVEVDFADIMICSEGMGLAFPLTFNDDSYQQFVKGESITLAAVPMEGYRCEYWEINGAKIYADKIEYKLVDESTVAVAHFTSQSSSEVNTLQAEELEVNIKDNTLYFPQTFEGQCSIYRPNGIMAKSIYLMTDRLNVADLPEGVYILSVSSKNKHYTAKFTR